MGVARQGGAGGVPTSVAMTMARAALYRANRRVVVAVVGATAMAMETENIGAVKRRSKVHQWNPEKEE